MKPPASGSDPRKSALNLLTRMDIPFGGGSAKAYSNILTDSEIKRGRMSPEDRALLTSLVMGVCERTITLDRFISAISSRPGGQIDRQTLAALRMGIWQIEYADRIPDHAAVYETVAAVKKESRGFVNGVLRNYLRRRGTIKLPEGNGAEALSVRYSVGAALCERYVSLFGAERAGKILAASFDRRLCLRTNTLKITSGELAEKLAAAGFTAVPLPTGKGFSVSGGDGLPAAVPLGEAFVQDEASQIAVEVLGARPGDRVLDVCACPGSKSFGAAADMSDTGEIVCCDLHESKLPLIASGAERLGISIIKTVCRDSSVPEPEFAGRFDRIICDVPCSGFGVISKKPELRYKDPSASAGLPELQYAILTAAAPALKPGGRLVYSTCTILPEENEGVVSRFLSEHPEYRAEDFEVAGRVSRDGRLTLLPDGGTDGFFIAAITK